MTIKSAAYITPVFLAGTALADAPNVVTDFAPVQAVVARVMEGVGTPEAILSASDDPHHFAMRPSHARMLSNADVVIWTGKALTPWLEAPIENLSDGSVTLELLSTEGWTRLEMRGEHSHDHEDHDGHDDHEDHDDHDDHGHEDATHDDHDHEEDKDDHAHEEAEHEHEEPKTDDHDHDHDEHKEDAGHDDHGHEDHGDKDHADHDDHDEAGLGTDPHAWVDPVVVAAWAGSIAETLAESDPDHAEAYLANASAFATEMDALTAELADIVADVDGTALIFSHDAIQYFEARFGIAPMDYIAANDAADAGPAHLRDLREAVESGAITCVFSDMETNPGTLNTLIEGTDVGTATLDLTNTAGTDYATMMRTLATTIATCES